MVYEWPPAQTQQWIQNNHDKRNFLYSWGLPDMPTSSIVRSIVEYEPTKTAISCLIYFFREMIYFSLLLLPDKFKISAMATIALALIFTLI